MFLAIILNGKFKGRTLFRALLFLPVIMGSGIIVNALDAAQQTMSGGLTAMAGAVGAGGLGDLAIRYGYQRKVPAMMWATVVLIVILVQAIQSLFSWLSVKMDKRLR